MWRVKTDAKFENSFFPVLIYWSDNRIHLGTIKKLTFVLLVPPLILHFFCKRQHLFHVRRYIWSHILSPHLHCQSGGSKLRVKRYQVSYWPTRVLRKASVPKVFKEWLPTPTWTLLKHKSSSTVAVVTLMRTKKLCVLAQCSIWWDAWCNSKVYVSRMISKEFDLNCAFEQNVELQS